MGGPGANTAKYGAVCIGNKDNGTDAAGMELLLLPNITGQLFLRCMAG